MSGLWKEKEEQPAREKEGKNSPTGSFLQVLWPLKPIEQGGEDREVIHLYEFHHRKGQGDNYRHSLKCRKVYPDKEYGKASKKEVYNLPPEFLDGQSHAASLYQELFNATKNLELVNDNDHEDAKHQCDGNKRLQALKA